MKKLIFLGCLFGIAICQAESVMTDSVLRVAALFGDHMVIQRHRVVPVWGRDLPGRTVTVSLRGLRCQAVAGSDSNWRVEFSAMEAGGPFEMVISDGATRISIADILIGEVWLCSGQSNMEFPLKYASDGAVEIKTAEHPQIRHLRVPYNLSLRPMEDLAGAEWKVCTPENAGDFTAVGYYFAKKLFDSLHVPVGLINATWGGSQIEGWISKEALRGSAEFADYAARIPDSWDKVYQRQEIKLKKYCLTDVGIAGIPAISDMLSRGYDFSRWRAYGSPGNWDWMGIWGFRGQLWMETDVVLDRDASQRPSILSLGTNDSPYELYINGTKVSAGQGSTVIEKLDAGVWSAGVNHLLVRQGEQQEQTWMGMGIHGEPGQSCIRIGDDSIPLTGYDRWRIMPDFASPYRFIPLNNSEASILYNGLIHPLVRFPVRGVIWYQGEANASRAQAYATTFQLLINSWCKEWGGVMPFLFVQLASYGNNRPFSEGSEWAELRESQARALTLPYTGMAVATDIGDSLDIHPKNKRAVGERLAAIALAGTYGYVLPFTGPAYKGAEFKHDSVLVYFTHVGKGLVTGGGGELRGFTVGDEHHQFCRVRGIIQGDHVVLLPPAGMKAIAVRYAWENSPLEANLYNSDGFPAAPFRTDSWRGLTDGKKFE